MKRFLCAVLLLCMLCSCTRVGRNYNLNFESLSTKFHAKIDGTEYEGNMAFDTAFNMILTITYPDIIKGLTMTFTADNVITACDNVDDTHCAEDFPNDFAFREIYNALKQGAINGGFQKNADKAYEMTCGGVTVIADDKGNITSAEVKNGFFIFGL
ncbi:MAG: hypothetical protein MJ120_04115 [Clostridia bacterium]|nr:hypothetical protein [Clostridia bacterium]